MAEDKKFEPVVDKKKVESPRLTQQAADQQEKDTLLTQLGAILTDYNNMESTIPLNNEYWVLLNRYRSL